MAAELERQRLCVAKRAEITARLAGMGMSGELAGRWLAAWEASSSTDAERNSLDFWERGGRWTADAWMAGQQPPTIAG